MAFDIIMMTNNSEKNRLTKDTTTIATLSGVLRSGSSIIDPVITCSGDVSSYVNCNYMEISEFGRYYFINDIIAVSNNLFEIHAHVDVLSSFATEIRSNKAIITRQEKRWNLLLNDGSFRTYQNPMVTTHPFPYSFGSPQFVLAVAGPTVITP